MKTFQTATFYEDIFQFPKDFVHSKPEVPHSLVNGSNYYVRCLCRSRLTAQVKSSLS